jgi:hypothetical protein
VQDIEYIPKIGWEINMTSRRIDIGSEDEIKTLYSYPNNCKEICFLNQTLPETIHTYLKSSIRRDGFSDAQIQVLVQNGRVLVDLDGPPADAYSAMLPRYLAVGRLAFDASVRLNRAKRWQYNWRFFLPHGVAMTRHRTVQLLHFPPIYVLERDQDYLSAHTTLRWADLLKENGANPNETDQYQNIVDIAPIAAPSDAGQSFEGIYGSYNDYILGLLKIWLRIDGVTRPMIAFGGPVRVWLKSTYNVDLRVLSCTRLQVTADLQTPVLAANHPSFIYNAVKQLIDDPNTPVDERLGVAMRIMQQDLVAAAWQTKMATDPSADPIAVLKTCSDDWSRPERQRRICELTYEQAFNKTPEEAKKLCAHLPPPHVEALSTSVYRAHAYDRVIDRLRDEIGALDSREPDKIATI